MIDIFCFLNINNNEIVRIYFLLYIHKKYNYTRTKKVFLLHIDSE